MKNLGVFYGTEENIIKPTLGIDVWEDREFLKTMRFNEQLRSTPYINKVIYLPYGAEVAIEDVDGYVESWSGEIISEKCKKLTIKYDIDKDEYLKTQQEKRVKEFLKEKEIKKEKEEENEYEKRRS